MGIREETKNEKKERGKRTYPLTDRCMALPNMEKPEVMAEKKPLFWSFLGLPIFALLTLKPKTPMRRRSEKKGPWSVRENEREREWWWRWKNNNNSDIREQRGQQVDRLAMTSLAVLIFYLFINIINGKTKGEWCFFGWFLLELCVCVFFFINFERERNRDFQFHSSFDFWGFLIYDLTYLNICNSILFFFFFFWEVQFYTR